MPSANTATRLRDRLRTQRNATVCTAVLLALPVTYAFGAAFGFDGSFLVLLTVGVVVPTLYDEYWPPYDETWKAVCWIVVASTLLSVAFTILYWVGVRLVALSPLPASTGSFLVTTVGCLALLARWSD